MHTLNDIFALLLNYYGKRNWWPAHTPYEMMVGAILTQNTNWTNVEKAIANMGDFLNPQAVLELSNEELAKLIHASGFHNMKAMKLKALTQWFKKYGFDVEQVKEQDGQQLRDELLSVKGVGRETADSILTYALDKPFFVIDAYTKRILDRLGFTLPKDYDEIRTMIENKIPRDLYIYNEFHALIVQHAKEHCKKKPVCLDCPLENICKKKIN